MTFHEHTASVTGVVFSQNNKVVLSSSLDGTVRAFDMTRYALSVIAIHVFYKKLVYKKLVLRWPKFQETLVLCLRSTKKLFKVKEHGHYTK